jgi:hypothetical protein
MIQNPQDFMDMDSNCKDYFSFILIIEKDIWCPLHQLDIVAWKPKVFYSHVLLLMLISIFKIFKLHPYQLLSQQCHFQIQPMGVNDDDIL